MTTFGFRPKALAVLHVSACVLTCLVLATPLVAQEPPPSPPAGTGDPPPSERLPFAEWLQGVRTDAIEQGIRAETVDRAFSGLEPLPIVVERDRSQAEFTLSIDAYLKRRLTTKLLRDTRRAWTTHRALLRKVAARYGVPAPVVVSVWALESNLGRFAGVRPTIATIATLAWEGRRADFFRAQLFDALRIVDRGDIEIARLKGSWAGAMGQVQFMPSSYLLYAVDFDGDGRRDIWTSQPDVFASIANYLKERGWREGETWGREVRLPADRAAFDTAAPPRTEGCRAEQELSTPLDLERWRSLGVRTAAGSALPRVTIEASLLGVGDRSFLVYPNYVALLQYNCAHAYALSVGLLSDRLAAGDRQSAAKKNGTPAAAAKSSKKPPAPKKTRPE